MARKSQESYQQFEDVSSYSSSKEYKKGKRTGGAARCCGA